MIWAVFVLFVLSVALTLNTILLYRENKRLKEQISSDSALKEELSYILSCVPQSVLIQYVDFDKKPNLVEGPKRTVFPNSLVYRGVDDQSSIVFIHDAFELTDENKEEFFKFIKQQVYTVILLNVITTAKHSNIIHLIKKQLNVNNSFYLESWYSKDSEIGYYLCVSYMSFHSEYFKQTQKKVKRNTLEKLFCPKFFQNFLQLYKYLT